MEATKKKGFWIILILFILVVIAIQVALPKQESTDDAGLIVRNQSNLPIGGIVVEYSRWDGSLVSEGSIKADNSAIEKGDTVYFFQVQWPAVVTVCADAAGNEPLLQILIEEAPEADHRWEVTVYDGAEGIDFSVESVPKEQK